jgi:hypothetical protein
MDSHSNSHSKRASNSEGLQESEAKCKEVATECSELCEHPWAGEYVAHPGKVFLLRLFLAPKAGAAFMYQSDAADKGPQLDFGSVTERDNQITIQWTRRVAFRCNVLFPVRWGERRYLVSEENVPEFFSVAEAGGNVNMLESFLLVADAAKPGQGVPQLPASIKKTTTTIIGTVTALGNEKDRGSGEALQEITLDIGAADGLVPGRMCRLNANDEPKVQVRVQSIGDHETKCSAIYRADALHDPLMLAVGAKVTFTKTSIAK